MTTLRKTKTIILKNVKAGSVLWAFVILGILILAPLCSALEGGSFSGRVYNSNGYPLGGARVELYNYFNAETPYSLTPLQSEMLLETQRYWLTENPLYSWPGGVAQPSPLYANTLGTTTRPPGLAVSNNPNYNEALAIYSRPFGIPLSSSQTKDTQTQYFYPLGSVFINPQDADSTGIYSQPSGNLLAISSQTADSFIFYIAPDGSVFISPQSINTTFTLSPFSGTIGINPIGADSASNNSAPSNSASINSQYSDGQPSNSQPSGAPSIGSQNSNTIATNSQPANSIGIASQDSNSTATNSQPVNSSQINPQNSDSTASNSPPSGSVTIGSQSDDSSAINSQPSGSVSINSLGSNSTSTNTQPSGSASINSQGSDSTASNSAPSGSAGIISQTNDSAQSNSQPSGAVGINAQTIDLSATNTPPSGSASIFSQNSNSTATNSPPTGSASITAYATDSTQTNTKPTGLVDPASKTSGATQTFSQPTGTVTITAKTAEGTSTTSNPGGAPDSQSGTWYTGSFTIDADDDGTADDTIYWVLTDTVASGVYDTMNLSYDSGSFNDGDTSNLVVGAGDDEGISDGDTINIGTYRFTVNFASDPGSASPDAWITSSEWYTGSFNIDVDGDGTIGASEYVNYTLSDSDSDGMYDTMDMSADDDTFGEGTLNDNLVGSDDDEQIGLSGVNITLGTYLFTVVFYENPSTASLDCEIQSKEWYLGSFTIDADDDGAADDILYYALSDMDSDGLYDTMDLSLGDETYGEGATSDSIVSSGNDESTGGGFLTLGASLEFEVAFDASPTADLQDAQITSHEWYEGTFTIDANGDGALESANVHYVLSDSNSNGLYDTMDLSIGDSVFDEGNLGNQVVDFSLTDNTDDERITAPTNITLGDYFLFTVDFAAAPNLGNNDTSIISKEWYEGFFTIDADGDGAADDNVYVVLSDTDSDGLYEALDISIGDWVYGEGAVDDNVVDYHASDNTNDERINASTDVTLGNYYLFTLDFDDAPNTDTSDARATSNEWYEGSFTIDADDDGAADDTVYYVLSDSDSNGLYDTMDISLDTTFGEGSLGNFNVSAGDDELITGSEFVTLGASFEFGIAFDSTPNYDFDDAWITSHEWYEGTFTIDGNGDGTLETDNVYFVLSDTNSDGVYDTLDISMGDEVYGEGNLVNLAVDFSETDNLDDERITSQSDITLGDYFLFTIGFDGAPNADSTDSTIKSKEWYEGTFVIDADGDGLCDNGVYYVLSDTDSDGLYEALDLSIADQVYGEGIVSDGIVDFHATDNTNDEQVSASSDITLGSYYLFTVGFDSDPNADATDAFITSKEWYTGSFLIDANDDGSASETVYYAISDSDSNGLYDTMDISADTTYGEGNLGDKSVTLTDDERITASDYLTLGNSLEFETSFDISPNADPIDASITSHEWYEGTFTIDADGDGTLEASNVHYVLSDIDSDGLYDTMDISMGDLVFGEGALGDLVVDFSASDNLNDESITLQSDITLGTYYLFSVDFDSAPNMDGQDAKITSKEWYLGTLTIDADGDGAADDIVLYTLSDTDSNGLYDTAELSIGDTLYGEGDTQDGIVDFDPTDNLNDEKITMTSDITLGLYYLFTVYFDSSPNSDSVDVQISSKEWYEGSFTLDGDDDGAADDTLYFVLSDSDSNGLYDTMDVSFDTTYGSGNLGNNLVNLTDDERITASEFLTLGNSLEFETSFDATPNTDSDDARITSHEWYEGTFTIDADGDGTLEASNVHYVLSDTDSDGLYDTMDISMGDSVYGEGAMGNLVVDFSATDNLDDERITSQSDLTLGTYYLFTVDFDSTPNMDSEDVSITSKEWYEGSFTIDGDGDGLSDDDVYFVLGDSDSNGLYDVIDISMGDFEFGEGNLTDGIVDYSPTDNLNDERMFGNSSASLGFYNYTVEFDSDPNTDSEDARIKRAGWYFGNFTIDSDSDGAVDDVYNFVLSDADSDGLFDTMDISVDSTYGEGALNDLSVETGNDERLTGTATITLGGTLRFELEFDASPGLDEDDARATSKTWFEGTFSIDADGDGVLDADIIKYALSDSNSNGQYDVMDISMGDSEFGEGNLSNLQVDFDLLDNNDDEQITSQTEIDFGAYLRFLVEFDSLPAAVSNDARITIKQWFEGTFTIDADADAADDDDIFFVLTDSDSNGLMDALDLSIGDSEFGEGNLADNQVDFDASNNTNDERITKTTNITLGDYYMFRVEFDGGPKSDASDARLISVTWFNASYLIDANDDAAADDDVYFVLSDANSNGLYDTMDISIEDLVFGEVAGGTLSDLRVNYVTSGNNNNDERISGPSNITLGNSNLFSIMFVPNPPVETNDTKIVISHWYLGTFKIDADDTNDDGIDDDSVNYVLTDLDSDGLYDIMDISINDIQFSETGVGTLSDGIVDYLDDFNNQNDERISGLSTLRLGDSLPFYVEFDKNPGASEGSDARLLSIQWYTGAFSVDVTGDGIVDSDGIKFTLTDSFAQGLYTYYMEITTDDGTYGEGAMGDNITGFNNDEIIYFPEYLRLGVNRYYVQHFDNKHDGLDVNDGVNYDARDVKITIAQINTGSALIEGLLRGAVVVDLNSDGVYDEVYIDLNENGIYNDFGIDAIALHPSDSFQSSALELSYTLMSINANGKSFEIAPTGASVGFTQRWFFGKIEVPLGSLNRYIVLLSDLNGNGVFDCADFDTNLPSDGLVDVLNLTETTKTVTLGSDEYQVINIEDTGSYVRITSFVEAVLSSKNDISLTNNLRYGIISESTLKLNLNRDSDMSDDFYAFLLDNLVPGQYETLFFDTDEDNSLADENQLKEGNQFTILAAPPFSSHTFEIDEIDAQGDFFRFKQTNNPVNSDISDSDGFYTLSAPIDGLYWVKVVGESGLWGYLPSSDTNSKSGFYVSNGAELSDLNFYLDQSDYFLYGFVTDSITGASLGNVVVKIFDSSGAFVASTETKSDGSYQIAAQPASGYDLVFSKSGYYTDDGRTTGTWRNMLLSSNQYFVNISLVPDDVPPAITIDFPIDSDTVGGTIDVLVTAADDHMVLSVEVSFDFGSTYHAMSNTGGNTYSYTWDTTYYPDGNARIIARVTDGAGHTVTDYVDCFVANDDQAPNITIVSPYDLEYTKGTYIITLLATDNSALEQVRVSVDGAWFDAYLNPQSGLYEVSIPTQMLSDGLHTLSAEARDRAGNTDLDSLLSGFYTDNTPPTLVVYSPQNNQKVTGSSVFLDVDSVDEGLFVPVVSYRIDSGAWSLLSGSEALGWAATWDSTSVSGGLHTISFRSKDDIGNVVEETIMVTVDNDVPTVSLVTPVPGEYIMGTYIFRVLAFDQIAVTNVFITLGGIDYQMGYNSQTGLWEIDLDTTTIPDGTYSITATVKDGIAAHTTTSGSFSFSIDNNPPSLSVRIPQNGALIYGSSFAIEANSTDNGASVPTVQYRIDSGAWFTLTGSEALGWFGSLNTTTVSNGIHTMHFRAFDGIGNVVTETVTVTVDNDYPVVYFTSPQPLEYVSGIYRFQVFASDEVKITQVTLTLNGTDYQAARNSANGLWEVSINTQGLTDGTYSVIATAKDGVAGHTIATQPLSFVIDNNGPSLSIGAPLPNELVSGSAVSILADSVDSGTSVPTVQYKVDSSAWKTLTGSEASGWSDSWDSQSVNNGVHTLTFRSFDGMGHIVTESILVTVDNDVPTASWVSPSNGEYLQGMYTFKLWAFDEIGVTFVSLNINGTDYPMTKSSESGLWEAVVNSQTLQDGSFQVAATVKDAIPSHTQITSALTIKIDNNAPTLSVLSPIGGQTLYGSSILVEAQSEDAGIWSPQVQFRIDSGAWIGLSGSEAMNWSGAWDTTKEADGIHTVFFRSYDEIGHVVETSITVTVDNTKPTVQVITPSSEEYLSGTYTFRVSASDSVKVAFVNITLKGIDYPAGFNALSGYWEMTVSTMTFSDGTYSVSASASDGIPGHAQSTSPLTFHVDNNPPTLYIISPQDGVHVRGNVFLNLVGSDTFLARVQYMIDNMGWMENTTSWDTPYWSDGEHSLSVRALDMAGHITLETISVVVDNKDSDGDGIGDLEDPDIDGDDIDNMYDAFPNDPTEWEDFDLDRIGDNADLDDDNDGVPDIEDDFPKNSNEWLDSDFDGTGDNGDSDDDNDGIFDVNDAFPRDPQEYMDTDSDGIGNNADLDDDNDGVLDLDDAFPLNPNEYKDSDGDGVGDNGDFDDDNDNVPDSNDAFPYDPTEWMDTDSDGMGNNVDLDDDNDGVSDLEDDFPLNVEDYNDNDFDSAGDNTDVDDDNDGIVDILDAFPLDASEWLDTDGDGIGNNADTDDDGDGVSDSNDLFPLDPKEYYDFDGDGIGDNVDADIDGDGVPNINDAFPYNASESRDTDDDGIGDQKDLDIDGDGVLNIYDDFPYSRFETTDTDSDGIGDNADSDDDNDGYPDIKDAFPLNFNEWADTDGDGIGDNTDSDLDNDGYLNAEDAFPTLATEWSDFDSDGIGDNSDSDDDNDGVVDAKDYYPYDKNSYLEPFWWWWILISVLVLLLSFVIFITNRRPPKGPRQKSMISPGSTRSPLKPRIGSKSKSAMEMAPPEAAQPEPEEEAAEPKEEEIECPACGMTFMVPAGDMPREIVCPYCGVTGALD